MNANASKLVLIPDPRTVAASPRARRYRIARLAVNPDRGTDEGRFEHLKRSYD